MTLWKVLLIEHHLIRDLCFERERQGSKNEPNVEVNYRWTTGLVGKEALPVLADVVGEGLGEVCIHWPFLVEGVDDWEVAEQKGMCHYWLDSSKASP